MYLMRLSSLVRCAATLRGALAGLAAHTATGIGMRSGWWISVPTDGRLAQKSARDMMIVLCGGV